MLGSAGIRGHRGHPDGDGKLSGLNLVVHQEPYNAGDQTWSLGQRNDKGDKTFALHIADPSIYNL